MGIRTNLQRVLDRLEAQRADDRIPHVLNELEFVPSFSRT